jgi:energy-coupling factor transporter ATP-binding protein EcfA2
VIRLDGVSYRYAGARTPSLRDVSLELPDGEVVGLMGASEAGKTTLCLVLAGLAPRAIRGTLTGRLLIDDADVAGQPMHELARLVGIVFQDPGAGLSGVTETVYEEVAFGPANLGVPRDELIERVEEALARLRIEPLADRHPARLSGGQQQLVAVAGALAMRPRHLVLDEPTAQLDPLGTRLVMDAVAELAAGGASILITEHKTDELARVASRALIVVDGAIVADGPASDVLGSPGIRDHGLEERATVRLARLVADAGLDPAAVAGAVLDPPAAEPLRDPRQVPAPLDRPAVAARVS